MTRFVLLTALIGGGLVACSPATYNEGGEEGRARTFEFEARFDPGEELVGDMMYFERNDTTGESKWFDRGGSRTIKEGWNTITTAVNLADGDLYRFNARFKVEGDTEFHYLVGYEYATPSEDVNMLALMGGEPVYPYTVDNDNEDGFDGQIVFTEGE